MLLGTYKPALSNKGSLVILLTNPICENCMMMLKLLLEKNKKINRIIAIITKYRNEERPNN